ncbi:MAG: radical SAM protein [Candidatus Electrothrix sp. ATG2]|nr:radical SAM protein [Candidatus Electrothrix sp. ATG2]
MNEESKKKLFLIMPPQQGLLNGFASCLISLANFIEKKTNVFPEIIDLSCCTFHEASVKITQKITKKYAQTLFVGITTTSASYQSALKIARLVKQTYPQAVLILGGHHAGADPENVLRSHANLIDVIATGEGEQTLYELICNYPSLNSVSGVAFLDNQGHFIRTDPPPFLKEYELDSLSVTHSSEGVIGVPGKFDRVTYVSSRGCPLDCAFCAVGNEPIRSKSIPAVIRDIEQLLELGFVRIAIEDNFFANSVDRTRDICTALLRIRRDKNNAFVWDCQTRVEALARKDTIDLLSSAGCDAVFIGVESLQPDQLVYLNKTKEPEKYLDNLMCVVMPRLFDKGIKCYLNIQFGLPGETESQVQETYRYLNLLGDLAVSYGRSVTIFPQKKDTQC